MSISRAKALNNDNHHQAQLYLFCNCRFLPVSYIFGPRAPLSGFVLKTQKESKKK